MNNLICAPKKIVKKIKQWYFRRDMKYCKARDFSIISSNCIGALPYQILGIKYNTPTVGLFFYAPCFIKFVRNLNYYLKQGMAFKESSLYPEGNEVRKRIGFYPLGQLDDIEIHFVHYKTREDVVNKWRARIKRINRENMFFIMTDRDLFNENILREFDALEHKNKICFTAHKYNVANTVQIKACRGQEYVGNLYSDYDLFVRSFNFSKWLSKGFLKYGARSRIK